MKIHIILESDEISRRKKIADFLSAHNAFNQPGKVVYLTINRRKIQDLEMFFLDYTNQSIWLPEFRTLRGYFDDYLKSHFPHHSLLSGFEKKILWTELIRDIAPGSDEEDKMMGILEDLLRFEHHCAMYGIDHEERRDFFEQHYPDLASEYKKLQEAYQEFLVNLPAIDYDEAPWWFALQEKSNPAPVKEILILDGFYWLYPYQKQIIQNILTSFEKVVWVENPVVQPAGWKHPSERNIPELIAEEIQKRYSDEGQTNLLQSFRQKLISTGNSGSGVYVLRYPTVSREVLDVTRYILHLIKNKSVSPDDITLVYSDPSYLSFLENYFNYHGIPYDIARGKPVTQIPVISDWTKFITLCVNRFPVEDTFYILSRFFADKNSGQHQFSNKEIRILKEWFRFTDLKFLSDMNSRLDISSWFEEVANWSDSGEFLPDSWLEEGEIAEEIPNVLSTAHKKLLGWMKLFPTSADLDFNEWIQWLQDSWQMIQNKYKQNNKSIQNEEIFSEIKMIFERVHALFHLSPRNYTDWVRLFNEIIQQAEFRETTGKGVRFLEKLEARDLTGSHLIITGACKHYFPSEVNYPGFFRELAEARKNRDKNIRLFPAFRESLYLFYDYIQNFSQIIFGYPARIREEISGLSPVLLLETGKLLSDYLKLDESDEIEATLMDFFKKTGQKIRRAIETIPELRCRIDNGDSTVKFNMSVKNLSLDSRLDQNPVAASIYDGYLSVSDTWVKILSEGMPVSDSINWSPSRLQALLMCPQKYWYGYWLHIQGKDSSTEGLDKRILGKLFHVALRIIFSKGEIREIISGDDEPSALVRIFEDGFNEAFEILRATLSKINPFYRFVIEGFYRRLQQQNYIKTLAETEWKRMRNIHGELNNILTEKEFKTKHLLNGQRSMHIKGRIDRVDVFEDRVWFCDYKYSSDKTGYLKRMYEGLYWQLILYRILLSEEFPQLPVSGAVYPIKKINERKPIDPGYEEFFNHIAEIEADIYQKLNTLLDVYDHFHFYTGILDSNKIYCSGCEYREICNRKNKIIRPENESDFKISVGIKEQDLFGKKTGYKFIPTPFRIGDELK